MPGTATSLRIRLGNEIRAARISAGLTQVEVAELLGCKQGKINKIEDGTVAVKPADLDIMLGAFGVGAVTAELMRELAASGDRRGEWSGYRAAVPTWFRTFTNLEQAASEIFGWHGERIHGALQSEHYMLTQFKAAGNINVTELVRNRRDRKRVFELKPPPSHRFVLGEGAFRRIPGGPNPGVALDQVQYLINLIETHQDVSIHILPFETRLPYVPNDFTIMRFTDGTPNCVFVEHVAGGLKIDNEAQFKQFVEAWDQLRGPALEKAQTLDFLRDLAVGFTEQLNG
ncbi:MAG TPA: helix-turn-helix transcriptional regulator [Pseudonocardiaceae bacterium]|nr:helix-turn-helix transcriptional regulator [Pseudonocardiaceae bacterium]